MTMVRTFSVYDHLCSFDMSSYLSMSNGNTPEEFIVEQDGMSGPSAGDEVFNPAIDSLEIDAILYVDCSVW